MTRSKTAKKFGLFVCLFALLSLLFPALLFPTPAAAKNLAPGADFCALDKLNMAPLAQRPIYSVKDFGAKGDGRTDDTTALQKAFDQTPSGAILAFPKGVYLHSRTLRLTKDGTILLGKGGILKATNTNDQAIVLAGNKSSILNLSLWGVGERRLTQPQTTKIVVRGRWNQVLNNNVAGGSSAGIFVFGASDFRISGNTVHDTLADGIHMTRGARRGLVENNIVYHTGDDPIAVVSYQNDIGISRDILIRNNEVSGISWGRGITVVGGENVLIENNMVDTVTGCAGILVAQEKFFKTDRVNNVLIQNNTIRNIQMGKKQKYTYQAAIDINSNGQKPVQNIKVLNNTIENSRFSGVRVFGKICNVDIAGNQMKNILDRYPVYTLQTSCAPEKITCRDNMVDGEPLTPQRNLCSSAQSPQSFTMPDFNSTQTYAWLNCR